MKRLLTIVLLLVIFGCNPPEPPDPQPQQFFGYLGTAIGGLGTGNYIELLSSSSNIATIASPSDNAENVDYVIDLVIEAQANGMDSVIWLDHLLFDIDTWGLQLYPDYQERWDRYSTAIAPYMDSIFMFYILDEPYWNGSHAGVSQEDMLARLEAVSVMVRATFPSVHVGSCFAYPSITEDLELPGSYTIVGFDYYYGQNMGIYFEDYLEYLDIFKGKMYSHQRLFLVPGAFQYASGLPAQNDLSLVADFFYDLFLTEPLVDMMIAFLYPSVPPGLIGLDALPALMAKYEEIGNLIINPDEIVEPKEPELANHIQRKSTNTSSIEEKEFHDLYDQAIDMLVTPDVYLDDDLYEQADELANQAQVIADELFYGKIGDVQRLITILTKNYGELYINIRANH